MARVARTLPLAYFSSHAANDLANKISQYRLWFTILLACCASLPLANLWTIKSSSSHMYLVSVPEQAGGPGCHLVYDGWEGAFDCADDEIVLDDRGQNRSFCVWQRQADKGAAGRPHDEDRPLNEYCEQAATSRLRVGGPLQRSTTYLYVLLVTFVHSLLVLGWTHEVYRRPRAKDLRFVTNSDFVCALVSLFVGVACLHNNETEPLYLAVRRQKDWGHNAGRRIPGTMERVFFVKEMLVTSTIVLGWMVQCGSSRLAHMQTVQEDESYKQALAVAEDDNFPLPEFEDPLFGLAPGAEVAHWVAQGELAKELTAPCQFVDY